MNDFLRRILLGARDLFRPLTLALKSEDNLRLLVRLYGWEVDGVTSENAVQLQALLGMGPLLDTVNSLADALASNGSDVGKAQQLLEAVDALFVAAEQIPTPALAGLPFPFDQSALWSELRQTLLDALIASYIKEKLPALYSFLRLGGLIEETSSIPQEIARQNFQRIDVRWQHLGNFLGDPIEALRGTYKFGTLQFEHEKLLANIMGALWQLGLPARLSTPAPARLDLHYAQDNPVRSSIRELTIPLATTNWEDHPENFEFALRVLPVPSGAPSEPPSGFQIEPLFAGNGAGQDGTADESTVSLAGAFESSTGVAFSFLPGEISLIGAWTSSVNSIAVAIRPDSPWRIFGSENATRVELSGAEIRIQVLVNEGAAELRFEAQPLGDGLRAVLETTGDSFVSHFLGNQNREVHIRDGIRWSSKSGLAFANGNGLSMRQSVNQSDGRGGAVHLLAVEFAVSGAQDGGALNISFDAAADLGPLKLLIHRLGARLRATTQEDPSNFGPIDVSLGFLPPTGAGIAIDSGGVSGGGFLTFAADRYTGALQLKFNQIAMSAFGVIDTKLPEGQDGFSFVIIISAEFQPIQLGLGFTLNGVGGLAGLNRTVEVEALRDVVRRGTMDKLLFPKNPANDAPEIIATLSDVFPPAKDRHVFGPMAKLGWGTPTLIEGRLGLLLELPEPLRLTLLGTVVSELPRKKDTALVKLKMDVLGVLDFADKSLAIDARLHDSQAGGYPMSGDMAMRLRWGDQPNFALSVGGLNPNYEPPPGFPALERVRIDLGKGDNPSIAVSAYLAITSNTAQIGARAELRASGAGIRLHGWIGFDALFIFTPFQFVAEIDAGVRVSFHGVGKSIRLHGQLSGPGPYRIKGKVCVSVAFWDACLSFDKSFGKRQQISAPEVDPWDGNEDFPGLGKALVDLRNWQGEPPPDTAQVVSLRTRARNAPPTQGPPGEDVGVDPLGTATFRQRVVPLNQEITRFGAVPLKETRLYKVASVSMPNTNASAGPAVQDLFAPAQYRTMKDAERISAPSFELMDAGFKLAGTNHAEGPRKPKVVKYKTSFIGATGTTDYTLPSEELPPLARRSAGARVGVDSTGLLRFVDRTVPRKLTIAKPGWVIALRRSLQRSPASAVAASYTTAATALGKLFANNANRQIYAIFPAHEIDPSGAP